MNRSQRKRVCRWPLKVRVILHALGQRSEEGRDLKGRGGDVDEVFMPSLPERHGFVDERGQPEEDEVAVRRHEVAHLLILGAFRPREVDARGGRGLREDEGNLDASASAGDAAR